MNNELLEAFRLLKKRDVDTFPATVVSVDKDNGTCIINADGLDFPDVQLSAIIDGSDKKCYLFPKVGSSILVSPINEDMHRLYVESYSEIESYHLHIESVQFQIDKNGFLLKKENESLKKLMSDLIKAIKEMKFTTNYGPTIKLINLQQFIDVGERFDQFLKDN